MISIIIPMYNRATLVGETLDSILAQTYTDWECIVVDDGSNDNSVDIVQKYVGNDSRFKLLIRPKDRIKGAPTCRNIGLENSKGEIIYFFDSDDLMSPLLFEKIANTMMLNLHVEYCVFQMDYFIVDPNKPIYQTRPFVESKGNLLEQILCTRVQVSTQILAWRRSVLEKSEKPWTEGLQRFQDQCFIGRMIGLANNGKWIEEKPMVHCRLHDQCITIKNRNHWDVLPVFSNRFDFYEKIGKMSPSIHWILFWALFRSQLICVVLMGRYDLSLSYTKTIFAKSRFRVGYICILFASIIATLLTPVIYLILHVGSNIYPLKTNPNLLR
jgi:glycosyltransferase involved in cell wall biosynthesis